MVYRLENEVITIALDSRLDTESHERVEKEVQEISINNPHKSLVLDAANLDYIASSGLRVILKLAKTEKDFKLINVCENVYNVFAMTGFVKIINISKALRRIDLEKCEKIGFGGNGAVYRISPDEIVKVNYNIVSNESLELELARAKEAFLLGVPTAISFDMVDCGEGKRGVVYETIKSKTLGETMDNNPDRLDELTDAYIKQLRALHSIHSNNPIFGRAKDEYRSQLEATSKYLTEEEVASLYQILEVLPDGDTLVHCDAHPKNLMISENEMLWIDMEKISVGHPIYDLISIAVVLKGLRGEEMSRQIAGMSVERLQALSDKFIRKYFNTDDEERIMRYNSIFSGMSLIRTVFAIGNGSPSTVSLRPRIIEMVREHFFPNVPNIVNGIKYLLSEL